MKYGTWLVSTEREMVPSMQSCILLRELVFSFALFFLLSTISFVSEFVFFLNTRFQCYLPQTEAHILHFWPMILDEMYSRIILMASKNTNIISNKNMAVFLASSLYPLQTAYNLQENNFYFVRISLSFIKISE